MLRLILAATFWIVLHVALAGPLRPWLVDRLGVNGFRGLFSLLSLASLAALVIGYNGAPYVEMWPPSRALALVPLIVMPIAFYLFVASLTGPNPTAAQADFTLKGTFPVQGVTRVTRHPMLWSFALWAAAHLVANGDVAAFLFFGAIVIVALNGMRSIDAKLARRNRAEWDRFARVTSRLPFAAIAAGRNKLAWSEIGWWRPALGLALFVLTAYFHVYLSGVPLVAR
jgi:uncharacterized membrane protein